MALPNFEYIAPPTVQALLGSLAQYGDRARIVAGGTDLLLLLRERVLRAECLIDISRLADLKGICQEDGKGVTIGAGTRIRDLLRSPVIRDRYHALHQAAGWLGSTQIRDMATLGGNSCNASPAAETPPPLIACGATVTLLSVRGTRQLPLEEFILGLRRTALAPDEVLASFHLPEPWPSSASRYAYAGLRDAMEIDLANVAVNIALDPVSNKVGQVRIVMGAVGPTPLRARHAEQLLIGRNASEAILEQAADACVAEARPIDDPRSSASYRRAVLKPLVRRTLAEAIAAIA
jgi:carbon-monoxide dehydrogenase medium subunit